MRWYLDCPLTRPPSSEVSFRELLELALKGKIASNPKPQSKESVKKGGKRKKSALEEACCGPHYCRVSQWIASA
jgi:hypothetical protein